MAQTTAPYPWGALTRLTRAQVEATHRARSQLNARLATAQIAETAGRLLGAPVEVHVRDVRAVASPDTSRGVRIALASSDGDGALLIDLEPALAVRIASAIAGKGARPLDPTRPLPPEVVGAACAFATLVARRCGDPWRVTTAPVQGVSAAVRAVVLVGDEAFDACVFVSLSPTPPLTPSFDGSALAALGDVPLSLPIVGAMGVLRQEELAALEVGAAWAPGTALTLHEHDGRWEGRALLVAPRGERGIVVSVTPSERRGQVQLAVGEGSGFASWDAAAYDETAATPEREGLRVVRAEVGAVTLRAHDWARIRRGETLGTAQLAAQVTLRAGGVAFARGEFATLTGETAIRIRVRG